jgi:hypothetical protein
MKTEGVKTKRAKKISHPYLFSRYSVPIRTGRNRSMTGPKI